MILDFIKNLFRQKEVAAIELKDFSAERYETAYPDTTGNAEQHYLSQGYKEGRILYTTRDMGVLKKSPTNETPLVSIIVTSYNYEKYIVETLDSLLRQTYKNYEIVVVDDGSIDSSVDIINSYVSKHENIRLYTHEGNVNKGLVASMQLAISNSKGCYVAFCESDDYWSENYLEEKVKIINKYEDVAIISNAIKMFGSEEDIKVRGWVCQHITKLLKQGGTPIDLRYNQEFNFIPTLSSVMIRKDVLTNLDFNTPIPAWIDFWLYRQILTKHILYFVDKEMTFWRQHDSFNSLENSSKIYNQIGMFIEKNNKLLGLN
ncbi:MAG: glycosyltransferase family 2 protein [Prevotella sp.]|nr:glycosyltransferase family 2 protein [Candidatus Prevotella equi]